MSESGKINEPGVLQSNGSVSLWSRGGTARRKAGQLIRVAVAALLLWLIAWRVDWVEFGTVLSNASLPWLFAVLAASAVDRLWMAGKWHYLIRRLGVTVRFIETLYVYYVGILVGMAAQWGLSGDITRAVRLARLTRQHKKVVVSVLLEKVAGFAASGVVAIGAAVLLNGIHSFAAPSLLMVFAVLAIIAFPLIPLIILSPVTARLLNSISARISSKFDLESARFETDGPQLKRGAMVFFFLTLGEQAMPVVTLFMVQLGLGIETGILQTAAVIPIITFLSRLPISVEGLGVYEGLTVLLFGLMGMSAAEALALAITSRAVGLVSVLLGAGVCLVVKRYKGVAGDEAVDPLNG